MTPAREPRHPMEGLLEAMAEASYLVLTERVAREVPGNAFSAWASLPSNQRETQMAAMRAALTAIEAAGWRVTPHDRHRWNIEEDGADLLVCKGDHEKSAACHYERYVPKLTNTIED